MNAETPKLGQASAAFAIAGTLAVLFNTVLAWAKYVYRPLESFMNLSVDSWIMQSLADVVLFLGLGLIFSKSSLAQRVAPNRLIAVLFVAVVLGGTALFVGYSLSGSGLITRFAPFLRGR